jgi:mono/diheme cytochrome c family protein
VLARGEQIARQICSICHVVAVNQEYPPMLGTPTPSFIEIAHRPETTAKGLRTFLKTTHWDDKTIPTGMPNPMLMPDQAVAVSRYIMSLRGDSAAQSR